MPYEMDSQVAEALTASMGENAPPPRIARGAWRQLQAQVNGSLALLASVTPMSESVATMPVEIASIDDVRIAARWYERIDASPGSAVLYLHGGGMIAGSIDHYACVVADYVDRTGVPMLAVDYRLAPDHPHPAPLQDCYAALLWLVDHADRLGVDRRRVAVMGDSAGGGLAAAVAIMARDNHAPLVRQILVYPMLDDRRTEDDGQVGPFATWTADDNWNGWNALLGDRSGGDDVPPLAAPARQMDLSGLAPAYVEVGDLDIFRNESLSYAARLAEAGVPLELHVHPAVPHAFERIAPHAAVSVRAMADRTRVICDL